MAVKVFVADPSAVVLETFVPVFHRWIQEHRVPGILVDVADYGHLPRSPGVVLVSHEANVAMDATEGPPGLLYTQKTALEGAFADRIKAVLKSALDACAKLEEEPEFKGALKFRRDEVLFLSNDRLAAPNTEEAFAALRPALASAFGTSKLSRDASDPRRRLAVQVSGVQS
jgi:hypothetical protein